MKNILATVVVLALLMTTLEGRRHKEILEEKT